MQNTIGKQFDGFVCLIGNDGAGKSTIAHLINQNLPSVSSQIQKGQRTKWLCIERSLLKTSGLEQMHYFNFIEHYHSQIKQLIETLKKIDLLTYSYAFENDWYNLSIPTQILIQGQNFPVYWVFIESPVQILKQRLAKRIVLDIYEHPKCIYYFNRVYKQLCFFYGIPEVPNHARDVTETVAEVYEILHRKINPTKFPSLKNLTPSIILSNNLTTRIQQKMQQMWKPEYIQKIYHEEVIPVIENSFMKQFYGEYIHGIEGELLRKMVAKWVQMHSTRQFKQGNLIISFSDRNIEINLSETGYIFEQYIQGESKLIYKLVTSHQTIKKAYQDKIFILLKGTIYSHKKQHTGEIYQLPVIRAKGSMIFMEMLKRNQIQHSYISINHSGVILSEEVETNNLEIIFKKEFLGTDLHSYIGLEDINSICADKQSSVVYNGGIYVRFDWRNPNHALASNPRKWINLDPFYYIIEKYQGKQQFFKQFLSDPEKCKPIGDKCISEDLIKEYADTDKIKQMVIEAYCSFQYYARQVGLQILDGCFMLDKYSNRIWSEINPDCLRVKSLSNEQSKSRIDYDKDIWRYGGSSAKEMIIKKWKIFNTIFVEYFKEHRFMDVEPTQQRFVKQIYAETFLKDSKIRASYQKYYQHLIRGQRQRQVIGTIDLIKGSPILVEQSIFKQKHSEGSLKNAWDFIKIMPQIVIVDIDGASGQSNNNQTDIIKLSRQKPNNIFAVGGGIRETNKAQLFLSTIGKIIISSNLDLIHQIPQQNRKNIIVQLSINEKNEILTHARTVNTSVDLITKIKQLIKLSIETISITFKNSEGKLEGLPRKQLTEIMVRMPGPIKTVIIAGGISTLHDLQFIWGFDKCIPQLGSAIWKNKISIGQIYSKLIRYDGNGLVSAIIKQNNDKILGMVYLNEEAIKRTCEQRLLYRFSRKHNKIMKKGEQSGNTQRVQTINIDCDNDCLVITVIPGGNRNFCHFHQPSCFYQNSLQNYRKDLISLQQHIQLSKQKGIGSGYSYKMQNNPQLAIQRTLQEIQELSLAENQQMRLQQSADSMAHLIFFWNSHQIKINDILGIMNERSRRRINRPIYTQKNIKNESDKIQLKIGIGLGKHSKFISDFMKQKVGIKLLENQQKERCYKINYHILDQLKLCQSLGISQLTPQIQIVLVSTKPKDMIKMLHKKFIDFGINYSNMISLYSEQLYIRSHKKVQNLKLALIKRKDENVQPQKWTCQRKGLIATEYPNQVVNYFWKLGISSDRYTLLKVTGHSQSYLNDYRFDYCDAIVNTGRTIAQNNLQIERVLLQEIDVVLFKV